MMRVAQDYGSPVQEDRLVAEMPKQHSEESKSGRRNISANHLHRGDLVVEHRVVLADAAQEPELGERQLLALARLVGELAKGSGEGDDRA